MTTTMKVKVWDKHVWWCFFSLFFYFYIFLLAVPSLVPGITQPPAEATPSVEREETETTAVTASTATTAEAEAEAEAAASSAVGAETAARRPTNAQQPRPRTPKQFGRNEDEDVGGDDNDDDQEFEVVGIDEGLLSGEEDPVELPPEQQSEVGF